MLPHYFQQQNILFDSQSKYPPLSPRRSERHISGTTHLQEQNILFNFQSKYPSLFPQKIRKAYQCYHTFQQQNTFIIFLYCSKTQANAYNDNNFQSKHPPLPSGDQQEVYQWHHNNKLLFFIFFPKLKLIHTMTKISIVYYKIHTVQPDSKKGSCQTKKTGQNKHHSGHKVSGLLNTFTHIWHGMVGQKFFKWSSCVQLQSGAYFESWYDTNHITSDRILWWYLLQPATATSTRSNKLWLMAHST